MIDVDEQERLLLFANELVIDAGAIARKYFRRPIIVDRKEQGDGFDPVTVADREIEAYLRQRISASYPDHSIMGEEQVTLEGSSRFKWIIDPIDGTRSFIAGSPMWGTLLGLMVDEDCLLGIMHQPFTDETFTGSSAGAFFQRGQTRQAITTRDGTDLNAATLFTTHPDHFKREEDLSAFLKVAKQCRLSRYGGDCYSYCLLAHGFIDLVIESDLAPYDIIPLIPIIEAAGGVISNWQGGPAIYGGNIIAAANDGLYRQALSVLDL